MGRLHIPHCMLELLTLVFNRDTKFCYQPSSGQVSTEPAICMKYEKFVRKFCWDVLYSLQL